MLVHPDALRHRDNEGSLPYHIALTRGSYAQLPWRESVLSVLGPAQTAASLALLPFEMREPGAASKMTAASTLLLVLVFSHAKRTTHDARHVAKLVRVLY